FLPNPDRAAFCWWGQALGWPTEWLDWAGCNEDSGEGTRSGQQGGSGGRGGGYNSTIGRQLRAIDQAYEDAYTVLELAGPCSLFFGGRAFVQDVLNQLNSTFRPLALKDGNGNPDTKTDIGLLGDYSSTMGSGNGIPDNYVYRLPGLAAVNTNGGFFNSGKVG